MTAFFLLTSPYPDPGALVVSEDPPAVRTIGWRLSCGSAVGADWPDGVRYRGDPGGRATPRDLVVNSLQILIASPRLRGMLEREPIPIEWLPITLETPRGRVLPQAYCIANPLSLCDALDPDRSEVEDLSIVPGCYSGLFRMVLRHEAIPDDLRLFRLTTMPSAVVVRDDLKAQLEAAGLTGLQFIAEGDRCKVY